MRTPQRLVAALLLASPAVAQRRPVVPPAPAPPTADTTSGITTSLFAGLKFRNIGPAVTGGRIGEVVVHPTDRSTWFVVVHSSGVWKTTNAGTTWTPIFDSEGSYSIGYLALDPSNPLTIWVGTGENNSQRSIGYGDGVYKSTDGGRSWKNMGLKASNHIGKVVIDPRKTDVVYVAATGSLWSSGGDRGVYKTTDGGKTWALVLKPDNEWTGAQSLEIDPKNPDILYATTYQRTRRQWGFIDGGPGSSIYKSTDAGATWAKITKGLPNEELGKIGLALSPADNHVLYAVVEAANRNNGLYRSADGGQNWEKMSGWSSTSPMYYGKLYADPTRVDRIYLMDTQLQVSDDGGRTIRSIQSRTVHVDHHALWVDPTDSGHLINGNDGGLYETFDTGATWNFRGNLSLTQFYKVDVDNALPFYHVCGGTQDNNSLCGPSRTINGHGQTNFDWFVIVGGDGFQPRVDPTNPDIIYGQWQHGELVRLDQKTGERTDIQPQAEPGDPPLKWHWDSPLIISPHASTRLYFGAQRLFRSDDRGDTWRAVSGDLTRQIDRNKLPMMGRVSSMDAIAKNTSTSFYGTLVSLSESPKTEGLIYAGTDDGLIQVTEDGGSTWRRAAPVAGFPDTTFVSDIEASRHDAAIVYATFNHHKAGDFKPYVARSTDRGRTWTSISANLPERGSAWTIVEDHVDSKILFVGTEFGLFVTLDGGTKWVQLKGGLPTTQIRDLAIQRRENDLVVATFGRGFYILHDYSPLRMVAAAVTDKSPVLFPVKEAKMYVEAQPLGGGPKGSQGDALWTAPNPPIGAAFSYYLKEAPTTRKATRQAAEKETVKKGADVPVPTWDDLRKEDQEEPPVVVFTVTDDGGNVVRRFTTPAGAGIQRVTWDLRYPAVAPLTGAPARPREDDDDGPSGPMAAPGTFRVQMAIRTDGVEAPAGTPQTFEARPLGQGTLPAPDQKQVAEFNQGAARLQRAAMGTGASLGELEIRLRLLTQAIEQTPRASAALRDSARAVRTVAVALRTEFAGDQTIGSRSEPTPVTIMGRIQRVIGSLWSSTTAPTATHRRSLAIASEQLGVFLPKLRALADQQKRLEDQAEAAGAPWTPGRIPAWRP